MREEAKLVPSDPELWNGVRDRVEADFATLFRRYNKAVYNFAFRATASWSVRGPRPGDLRDPLATGPEGTVDPLRRDSALPILLAMTRNEVLNHHKMGKRRLRLVEKSRSSHTLIRTMLMSGSNRKPAWPVFARCCNGSPRSSAL